MTASPRESWRRTTSCVAPVMLPHIAGRPVTLERFHRGIGEKGFFQKNVVKGAPAWLERVAVPKKDGVVNYPVVRDTRGIMWLANQNCITPHVWTSRVPDALPSRPLRLRPRSARWRRRRAALGDAAPARHARRARLHELGEDVGIEGIPRRVRARRESPTAAKSRASRMRWARARPPRAGSADAGVLQGRSRRAGFSSTPARNEFGATYRGGVRGATEAHAPVSAPCTWEEVESGEVGPQTFTLRTMADRLDACGDLWSGLFQARAALPAMP